MLNIIETNLVFKAMDTRKATERIILHHAEASNCSAEDIHRWHLNNGWSGAGYHFLVRKDGSIYRLRPEDKVGAHAGGNNSNSIGICFEGKYETEIMPEVQIKAGQELVSYLKQKYGISIVQAHRDVCNTSCPGKNFPFDEIANAKENKASQNLQKPRNAYERFVGEVQKTCGLTGKDIDYTAGPITLDHTVTVSAKINKNHAVVTPLERYLKILGFYNGEIEADLGRTPIFGKGMTEAVNRYQKEVLKYIKTDGEITKGKKMWKSLLKLA